MVWLPSLEMTACLMPHPHSVEPAPIIGEFVPIRHVEDGELVVSAQAG
jgi:hypothetical protein